MTPTIRLIASAALVTATGLTVMTSALSARQSAAASKPSFEVASIKPSAQLDAGGTLRMEPGGLFRAVNVDTMTLLVGAYRTPERRLFRSQVIGAPAWLSSDRYDITAELDADLAARPSPQLPSLLQTLLEAASPSACITKHASFRCTC
jgi:hypothetical protein